MNTRKNSNIESVGVGLILGNIFAAILGLLYRQYFNVLGIILFTIVSLGVGLILLAAFFEEENVAV